MAAIKSESIIENSKPDFPREICGRCINIFYLAVMASKNRTGLDEARKKLNFNTFPSTSCNMRRGNKLILNLLTKLSLLRHPCDG